MQAAAMLVAPNPMNRSFVRLLTTRLIMTVSKNALRRHVIDGCAKHPSRNHFGGFAIGLYLGQALEMIFGSSPSRRVSVLSADS